MRFLFTYLKRYKKTLLIALGLAVINQVFSLLDPQVFRLIIDNYATNYSNYTQHDFVWGVLGLIGLSILVALVSRTAKSFQDYFTNVTTQRVGTAMYADSVEHTFRLPFQIFEDRQSGEILQKMQKAKLDSQNVIQSFVNTVFLMVIGVSVVIGYAFYVHWLVGFIYVLITPIIIIATFLITRRVRAVQKTIVLESASLAGATTETLRNVELVKSLGIEGQEVKRLNDVNENILALEIKKVKLIRTMLFIQGTMINTVRAGIMFTLLFLMFRAQVSLGEFFVLFTYSFTVFAPLYDLGNVASQYQEAKASLEELQKILSIQAVPDIASPETLEKITSVAFDNVSFTYDDKDQKQTIIDISLSVETGETIAFVGPSGSGKTTLVKLLLGLYDPASGEISVADISLSKIDKKQYRKKIGLVSQDTQLFAGTIRQNLLFVKPEATDEECLLVLKQAAATNILERGSGGLETKIGEGGLKLSGGEKQRLAIARALLRQPELIIFDEATSSLDSITEKAITETIEKISQSKISSITVLIAHRLSTIAHANRIYVLEKGRIVETGDHHSLLAEKGLYAAMWREQQARSV